MDIEEPCCLFEVHGKKEAKAFKNNFTGPIAYYLPEKSDGFLPSILYINCGKLLFPIAGISN